MIQPRRVALFGGTFDPIHVGHLAAARAAVASGLVDEVLFIPAGDPPHKPAGAHASTEERWLMTHLATLDEPRFRVVRWEIDREGPSFAVDTVHHARKALAGPDGQAPELYWVIGTDAMALIDTWRRVRELFSLTRFLVIARSGFDEAALRQHLAGTVPWAPPDALRFVPMDLVEVSSTAIRGALAGGATPEAALPAPVERYVTKYGLYRAQEVAR
ncbi:MAG: nicotinate-nucleotide adenylyltransferase [Candidatus Sericytochromatia bacterium]